MKKIIIACGVFAIVSLFGAVKAHADMLPNDTIRSTATLSVFVVANTPTLVETNSPAMKKRTTFALQNISTANVWCGFNASVAVSGGWVVPPWASLSIPMSFYSALLNNKIQLYCVSEAVSSKLAVIEGY